MTTDPLAETVTHEISIVTGRGRYHRSCSCGYKGMECPGEPPAALIGRPCPEDKTVTSLCTLQFAWGGLLDSRPADNYAVHLVRSVAGGGTPGPTLCGIDRFAKNTPGWSMGGGLSGPKITHKPCPGCAEAARGQFPGIPVSGSTGAKEMAEHLGVSHARH